MATTIKAGESVTISLTVNDSGGTARDMSTAGDLIHCVARIAGSATDLIDLDSTTTAANFSIDHDSADGALRVYLTETQTDQPRTGVDYIVQIWLEEGGAGGTARFLGEATIRIDEAYAP